MKKQECSEVSQRTLCPSSPDSNILANMEFGSEVSVALKDSNQMLSPKNHTCRGWDISFQDPLVIKILTWTQTESIPVILVYLTCITGSHITLLKHQVT